MVKTKTKPRLSKAARALGITSTRKRIPRPSVKKELDKIAAVKALFMDTCRLCESRDGPFLYIFDTSKLTAKRIDTLMPFRVAENDDLPHQICFRCSAKLEELYEFIQKCIKTQQNLHSALGRNGPVICKSKSRAIWEEKLNQSNMSNDEVCNSLIKMAMEGVKLIALKTVSREEIQAAASTTSKVASKTNTDTSQTEKKYTINIESGNDNKSVITKDLKVTLDKCDNKLKRKCASGYQDVMEGSPINKRIKNEQNNSKSNAVGQETSVKQEKVEEEESVSEEDSSSDVEIMTPPTPKQQEPKLEPKLEPNLEPKLESNLRPNVEPNLEPKLEPDSKLFCIMDHVSTIKVNGVGVLYQCKLCNRNFLKKKVLRSHPCAKSGGVPKVDFTKRIIPPEPPKPTVVKYINTKVDGELGKLYGNNSKSGVEVEKAVPVIKPKPRIGPASKVRRDATNPTIGMTVAPIEETPIKSVLPKAPPPAAPAAPTAPAAPAAPTAPTAPAAPTAPTAPAAPTAPTAPAVNFSGSLNFNSRFKIVVGPDNVFHLVEEGNPASMAFMNANSSNNAEEANSKPLKKENVVEKIPYIKPEIIDLDDPSDSSNNSENKSQEQQPYPVGLFSTVPHQSSVYPPKSAPELSFTTTAMKKQSYTIVQTGNPSKLLISTKRPVPVTGPSKKRQRKVKNEVKKDPNSQPFRVTLEDALPPEDSFFTFVNVDPLLQPSYVLPTDPIIQESHVLPAVPGAKNSADNKDKDKYTCNMCNEEFTREKKLLAHIHSHYNEMDKEDILREKNKKKRGKK